MSEYQTIKMTCPVTLPAHTTLRAAIAWWWRGRPVTHDVEIRAQVRVNASAVFDVTDVGLFLTPRS